ncbi:MAG: MMPL family transporter [Candidatus Bipolaricaulota bacterium]|nr:MMPL family transporter [Candidatus Bipolaricaulota bacterium]
MLDKLLRLVYRLVRYKAYWVIGVFLVIVVVVLTYIFPFPIRSSLLDLLPQNDPLIEEYKTREETINSTQELNVVLTLQEPKGLSKSEREAELLELAEVAKPLLEEVQGISSVSYRGGGAIPEDYDFIYSLNSETIGEAKELRRDLEDFAGESTSGTPEFDPEDPYGDITRKLEGLESGSGGTEEELSRLLEELKERNKVILAGLGSVDDLNSWNRRLKSLRQDFRSVRRERAEVIEGEYFSPDRTTLLIKATPVHPESHNIEFSRSLTDGARKAVAEVKESPAFKSGNYEIGLTGSFVINAERNSALKVDMLRTTIISSVAVMVAFFFALGSFFYSVLIAFPLGVAVLLALSWAKFSVGGFNLLTTFLPALVLGLSIDYGIHLLFRFSEERLNGLTVSRAVKVTILKKGKGIFIAALTTAAVFTTLIFSRSQGLVEMGIITSLGIMISFFVYLFLLPATIITFQRWRRRRQAVELFDYRATLRGAVDKGLKYRKSIIAISLVISLVALLGATRLDFQFTSNNVSTEVEGIRVQERIQEKFESSETSLGPSFVFFPDNTENLRKLEEGLGEMDLVTSTRSVRDYVPDNLEEVSISGDELEKLERLDSSLAGVQGVLRDREEKVERLESLVAKLSSAQLTSTLSSRSEVTVRLNEVIDQLLEIRRSLLDLERARVLETTETLRNNLDYLKNGLTSLDKLLAREDGNIVDALPEEIRSTFTTDKGEYVVFAGVEKTIYESQNLNSFVEKVSEFTTDYFGLPLIQYELEGHIRHDFVVSTLLAVVMISFVLYRGISDLKLSLLAVIPLIIGYLWMLGGMKVLGMNFNFINIIISPLLIGIGVDDGLHLIYRWQEEREVGGLRGSILSAFSHTGLAVITTSITTIVVFGSLFLARTPGLRILGATASLGIGFAMVLSLTVLPAALYLAFSRDEK